VVHVRQRGELRPLARWMGADRVSCWGPALK
jgi:hypothetical protein